MQLTQISKCSITKWKKEVPGEYKMRSTGGTSTWWIDAVMNETVSKLNEKLAYMVKGGKQLLSSSGFHELLYVLQIKSIAKWICKYVFKLTISWLNFVL